MDHLKTDPATDAGQFKGRTGLGRILNATGYSMAGLKAAFTGEAAFRQLVMINLVLIPLAFWLDVSRAERAVLVGVVFLGLIVEILNSAIEATVDRVSLEIHPLAKRAKDMGSAAQFLALSLIALVWGTILL
ncbi:MAG TPA: diacylglycerol kinase [Pseudomonas sp.]|nr:diacylglycerol kinase [Pseudomonas sp.]